MRFIGVDPGSNYTGVAVLEEDGTFSFYHEYNDPIEVVRAIFRLSDPIDIIVIEDFIGGGQRNTYSSRTLRIVGYLFFRLVEAHRKVKLVVNQRRLANVKNVPPEITGKDEKAAAAHALSEREEWLKKRV